MVGRKNIFFSQGGGFYRAKILIVLKYSVKKVCSHCFFSHHNKRCSGTIIAHSISIGHLKKMNYSILQNTKCGILTNGVYVECESGKR